MYRGANQLKVDGKGRMALPTRYRDELLERCNGALVVTVNATADNCLWLYPMDVWEQVEKQVNKLSSMKAEHVKFKRFFVGYAADVDMDKTGRILLSPALREFAKIDKQIHFVGQGNKFEIWNSSDWEADCDEWLTQSAKDIVPTPDMEELQL
jgi:MraZ protein